MILASVLLVFFARVILCQNVETYRYDIANVTSADYLTTDVSRVVNRNDSLLRADEKLEISTIDYTQRRRKMDQVSSLPAPSDNKYIPICCEPGLYLVKMKCSIKEASFPAPKLEFPPMYRSNLSISETRPEDLIPKYGIPCAPWDDNHPLLPPPIGEDVFYLLENGTIFHDYSNTGYEDAWYTEKDYCWATLMEGNLSKTIVAVCFGFPADEQKDDERIMIVKPISMILSLPFFIATFVTYSILSELKNMHGSTLRMYVACLFFAYVALIVVQLGEETVVGNAPLCISLAYAIHFSFMASFFWLNVMCFDIWWNLGGFRSLQGSVRQREKKKFIIYSVYAWGSSSFITGICLIMEFIPSVPTSWIKPEFGKLGCWFYSDAALAIYFYGPMGLTVVCNICLFVSTAMKIVQHKKDTAHHLKGMDSRRHDDNKQWFNLYLKLFMVMGINWSMEIASWLFKDDTPKAVWIITDLANALQGFIIFVIFVWKDKIKRLLLKRLSLRERNFKSGNSSRSGAYHSSSSRSCPAATTATVMVPLQEKNVKCYSESAKTTTDESDGV